MRRFVLFKGTESEYQALHDWVRKHLGRPAKCENCGTTESKRFDWANISGEYLKDLSDWARLCSRCHNWIDGPKGVLFEEKSHCKRGHEMTGANVWWERRTRGGGHRFCHQCKLDYCREYMSRKRAGLHPSPVLALAPNNKIEDLGGSHEKI